MSSKSQKSGVRSAFSLIELLVVMGVIILLMALIVPAFNSIGRSTNLTVAAQQLADQFNAARQQAIARNRQVELRIYKIPDEADSTLAYRALRVFVLNNDGSVQSRDRLQKFPKGIVISENSSGSTLSALAASTTNEDLPGFGASPYVYLRFRPDGSTGLNAAPTLKWFWTLVNSKGPLEANGLPANFATIQLDPLTGRPKLFRP